jgi:hypothetical protein
LVSKGSWRAKITSVMAEPAPAPATAKENKLPDKQQKTAVSDTDGKTMEKRWKNADWKNDVEKRYCQKTRMGVRSRTFGKRELKCRNY